MMSNINLVASGSGVSIVPASMRGTHPHSVVYRDLPADPALAAPITLAWHRNNDDALSLRFLELARRTAATLAPAAGLSRGRRRASATA
jgi:hypothetical protein